MEDSHRRRNVESKDYTLNPVKRTDPLSQNKSDTVPSMDWPWDIEWKNDDTCGVVGLDFDH